MANDQKSCVSGRAAFDPAGETLHDGDYLANVIAVRSYKEMRRFLVRHVAPHADGRIRKLLALDDESRALLLSKDQRAVDAWAVAIWTADVERHARRRLWFDAAGSDPYRHVPSVIVDRNAMGMFFPIKAPGGTLTVPQAQWLLRHATLSTLLHRFARARSLVEGMVNAGSVGLGEDMLGPNRLEMRGELLLSGEMRFVARGAPMNGSFESLPHRTKEARRAFSDDARRRRVEALQRLCSGLCLRFSWHAGWVVVASSTPDRDGHGVKRHRLFAEGRPHFVIFETSTGWCARLVAIPLEVHDEKPWMAIDTLRIAFERYRQLPGRAKTLPCPPQTVANPASH